MQGGLQGVGIQGGNALNSVLTALRTHAGHSGCCHHGNWTRVKSSLSCLKTSERKTIYSGQMSIKYGSYIGRYFDFGILALFGVQAGSLMS